jgi:hypothetical protein
MPTILDAILESFYEKLTNSQEMDEETVKGLRALFQTGKKLRADDFVAILSKATREGRLDPD